MADSWIDEDEFRELVESFSNGKKTSSHVFEREEEDEAARQTAVEEPPPPPPVVVPASRVEEESDRDEWESSQRQEIESFADAGEDAAPVNEENLVATPGGPVMVIENDLEAPGGKKGILGGDPADKLQEVDEEVWAQSIEVIDAEGEEGIDLEEEVNDDEDEVVESDVEDEWAADEATAAEVNVTEEEDFDDFVGMIVKRQAAEKSAENEEPVQQEQSEEPEVEDELLSAFDRTDVFASDESEGVEDEKRPDAVYEQIEEEAAKAVNALAVARRVAEQSQLIRKKEEIVEESVESPEDRESEPDELEEDDFQSVFEFEAECKEEKKADEEISTKWDEDEEEDQELISVEDNVVIIDEEETEDEEEGNSLDSDETETEWVPLPPLSFSGFESMYERVSLFAELLGRSSGAQDILIRDDQGEEFFRQTGEEEVSFATTGSIRKLRSGELLASLSTHVSSQIPLQGGNWLCIFSTRGTAGDVITQAIIPEPIPALRMQEFSELLRTVLVGRGAA